MLAADDAAAARSHRAGGSSGLVLLSWLGVEEALNGSATNPVVCAFARALDEEYPHSEGAPILSHYRRWAGIMQAEFEDLRADQSGSMLSPYGAESAAEFFAVAVEAYFQRGPELADRHLDLYQLLREFFLFDSK